MLRGRDSDAGILHGAATVRLLLLLFAGSSYSAFRVVQSGHLFVQKTAHTRNHCTAVIKGCP